jgi:SAM-dependent methyltransferase
MHANAFNLASAFVQNHLSGCLQGTVIDVGSRRARRHHQTMRQLFDGWQYIGIDIRAGTNVDLIVTDRTWPDHLTACADVVISANCLEHVTNLRRIAINIKKAMKPGSLACMIAPCVGRRHCEIDCWRILPDGMRWMFGGLEILECRISGRDTVGIFRKPTY